MNPDHPPKKSAKSRFSATEFPSLRSFLRGYFHQDMNDEYGSPLEAVREFCSDAGADERAAVAEEWSRFLDRTKGQPIEEINRALTGELGSSCTLTSEEVRQISSVLSQTAKKLGK